VEHHESSFSGLNDFNIYYQCWLPDDEPLAVLLIAHGFAEHSSRYGNLVDHFLPLGYAMYALDHRGHGRSDGERVHVDHYTDYTKDLKTFFDLVSAAQPGRDIFVVGHSMGASISLSYVLEHQQELAGLAISGGGISPPGAAPPPPRAAGAPLPTDFLSHDPVVIEAYVNDPLVYRGPIPTGRASAMAGMREALPGRVHEITLPILIMAGADVPDGERSTALCDVVGSDDKTLRVYEGMKHEIFNEQDHSRVMADLEHWLAAHL